ncbi:MAG: HAMP domain-containing histidine kinase [Anaerolineae bacterium]|nr:HAMP domain-containing histidine kinase [Anaerolineae bacterium]
MSGILENVQQRLAPMISEYNADLTLPTNWPTALGYAPWIEEVWANYITNAIKYGGRLPVVICGAESHSPGLVQFWVRDNGTGLSEAVTARLFTPFNRKADDPTEGHGLGLSIVKRIVTRLGGDVGVESNHGEGSRFIFSLPAGS